MVRSQSNQIKLVDFNQPCGMELDPNDEWIVFSNIIPWSDWEQDYIKLFPSKEGRPAISFRMAFAAIFIQLRYGFSDRETVRQIKRNPYFQYFCGLPKYTTEEPFNYSLMCRFRKRISDDMRIKMIDKTIEMAEYFKSKKIEKIKSIEDKRPLTKAELKEIEEIEKSNETMIIDATVAPSNIKHPNDANLLYLSFMYLMGIIVYLFSNVLYKDFVIVSKEVKKRYVSFSKKSYKTKEEIKTITGYLLEHVKSLLDKLDSISVNNIQLPKKMAFLLQVIRVLYTQQNHMYLSNTNKHPDRIVSITQPWLRAMVRNKSNALVEFGAKINVSYVAGLLRIEKFDFNPFNEGSDFILPVENYFKRYGCYPKRILADGIYRTVENINYCKERKISLTGKPLNKKITEYLPNKEVEYRDLCERNRIEGSFSVSKNKCGLDLIMTKLEDTAENSIYMAILMMNLYKLLSLCFSLNSFLIMLLKSVKERAKCQIKMIRNTFWEICHIKRRVFACVY